MVLSRVPWWRLSLLRVPRTPKVMRPFSTSASVGFSLMSLFSMKSVTDVLGTSESASVLREASPAAPTKQPYTLVFVHSSAWGVSRQAWQSWIMYFREAGYDCLDVQVELPAKPADGASRDDALAEQISSQVRQSALQREPVLFVRDGADETVPSYLGHGGLFSNTRGPMSGLVLLHPRSPEILQKADWPSGTPVLVIPAKDAEAWEGAVPSRHVKVLGDRWSEKEGLLKEVESWMRYVGL